MKKVIIMRGVPGSGKSTKAMEIATKALHDFRSVKIVSADFYFINKNGEYKFQPKHLRNAHTFCIEEFEAGLASGVELVIVDNTNTRLWEYEKYIDKAHDWDYHVEILSIEPKDDEELLKFANRNTHGVPVEKVKQMWARWES